MTTSANPSPAPARSALLVMDVQRGILERLAEETAADYLGRLTDAVAGARDAGIPVIYVVIGFRAGHPEIAPSNASFSRMAGGDVFTPADPGAEIHPAVAPLDDEVVVTKKRVSAFAGSDLDLVLRGGGIGHLVLTGVATSGVVLSTLRRAADLDFRLTVLADACLDTDDEVHRVLTEKVFPRQAEITDVAGWVASLG